MSSPAASAPRTSGTPLAGPATSAPLPVQLTSFVGREGEIATARQLLGTTRLLTLTGAGGSGKTRLARELAAQVAGEYEDGLAWIELAPLSSPELLPQQIASALGIREEVGRAAVPRQQTLRAAMDWSYALLDERERMLFQRLSVFAGGFTIAAAEAVGADGSLEAWEVLDLLAALVDKSLVTMEVRSGEARYGLLETVR